MEKPNFDWNTFVGRKRLDVAAWFKTNGIVTYEDLQAKCASLGIEPPARSVVSSMLKIKKPVKQEEPKPDKIEVSAPKPEEKEVAEVVEETTVIPPKKTKKKNSKKKSSKSKE
jgi:hypothetical protein